MEPLAIIGCGLIGRGWAVCFARAGVSVRLWDPKPGVADAAIDWISTTLANMADAGLTDGQDVAAIVKRVTVCQTLAEAVDGVRHVQECAPEKIEMKRSLFAELDRLTPRGAVIASSASALMASSFTEELPGRGRCLVAHPVNPPHLVPLVEVVPAPWTEPEVVERTVALMADIGQKPIRLDREIDGFVLNRLQAAILDEAFRLVDDGYADAEGVDACIRDGLAMRWVFMGPFETIDLNSPKGVREYVERYQPMFRGLTSTMGTSADWSGPVLNRIEAQRRERLEESELPERQAWRDRQLMALATFRRQQADAGKPKVRTEL